MKFVRKNKYSIIAIVILIILVIVGVQLKNIFVPDEGKAAYGSRLEGINEHKLDKDLFKNIETKLKEDERILSVENKVHGKIINLIITVNDDMSIQDAKSIANSTIGLFTNNELSFYSLQVFVKKNNEALNNFPIIGYKDISTSELIFTKDRDIVETKGE